MRLQRLLRAALIAALAFVFIIPSVRAAQGLAADITKDSLAGYDAFVGKMLEDWKVPGLAVAIVKGNEVIYAKGYGYRDVEKKLPVTPDTLFAVGSCTKAFTTFVMGTLVDEGKLDWDKPVRMYIPGFRMYDAGVTELITPRDLVTHRSGLPRHDLIWYNNKTASRKEIVERLRYLEPNESLRAKWQYNNLMFLTAGYLVEVITGKSWEDNVRERIFTPVGMTHSNFSVADSQQTSDFSLPYDERPAPPAKEDKLQAIPFRDINLIGPAGAINSSVNDMAKWLRVQLGHPADGAPADRPLLSAPVLADLHAAQMVIDGVPERPELSQASYALGWGVSTYRGHALLQHGGGIDGFTALVALLPQDDLGIVILTNRNGTSVPGRLERHTIDRLLKLPPIDWNGEDLAKREQGKKTGEEAKAKKATVRKPGTKPAHQLAEYVGEYQHPGYGTLKIAVSGDKAVEEKKGAGANQLDLTYNDITAPFEHWHYEVWNGKDGAPDPTFKDIKIQFHDDLAGDVTSVSAQLEPQVADIVFTKKPDSRLFDAAYLARFTGDYTLAGQPVRFDLQGNTLTATLKGQPTYHLVPGASGAFVLKEVSIISVRFAEDAQGNVTSATFVQPNGLFEATKNK